VRNRPQWPGQLVPRTLQVQCSEGGIERPRIKGALVFLFQTLSCRIRTADRNMCSGMHVGRGVDSHAPQRLQQDTTPRLGRRACARAGGDFSSQGSLGVTVSRLGSYKQIPSHQSQSTAPRCNPPPLPHTDKPGHGSSARVPASICAWCVKRTAPDRVQCLVRYKACAVRC
jgi:hypothetical protein